MAAKLQKAVVHAMFMYNEFMPYWNKHGMMNLFASILISASLADAQCCSSYNLWVRLNGALPHHLYGKWQMWVFPSTLLSFSKQT